MCFDDVNRSSENVRHAFHVKFDKTLMSCVPQKQEQGCQEQCSFEKGRNTFFKVFLAAKWSHQSLAPPRQSTPLARLPESTFIPVVDSQAWLCSENQQTSRQEACASFYQMVPGLVMASPDNSRWSVVMTRGTAMIVMLVKKIKTIMLRQFYH